MTGGPGAKDAPHTFSDEDRAQGRDPLGGLGELERRELVAWVGEHLPEVRRTASGQRPVYWILGLALVVGLAAHVGGYVLRTSTADEPLGLIADLLYAVGFALWTGVIVVVFVQIIPEAKRRQYKAALDAYEAALREEAGARSAEASPDRQPKFRPTNRGASHLERIEGEGHGVFHVTCGLTRPVGLDVAR